jgi:hypothetical protein
MSDDDDVGGYRSTDPSTSKDAAEAINTSDLEWKVLKALEHAPFMLNGFDLTQRMGYRQTITIVPRLAPLRRRGLIEIVGKTPGPPPKYRAQNAYVITLKGRAYLARGESGTAGGAPA